MKSIKFRKITRKHSRKKYKCTSQKTKSVKMKYIRKNSKERDFQKKSKKKYYHKGGAEPTEEEKKIFFDKIVQCIDNKPYNYKELIRVLSQETNVDLFNIKVLPKETNTEYPLLFFLMNALTNNEPNDNILIKEVLDIFIEKKADMNITIIDDSLAPVQLIKHENILYYEVMAMKRSYFIDLLIENGVNPNSSIITIQNNKNGTELLETIDASVFTHCCRALCITRYNSEIYKKEDISKIFECFKVLLNNSKVDVNRKGVARTGANGFLTNVIVALQYAIQWIQYEIFEMILNNDRVDPNVDILDNYLLQLGSNTFRVSIINYCINRDLFDFVKLLIKNDKFNVNIITTDPMKKMYYYSPLTLIIQNINKINKSNNNNNKKIFLHQLFDLLNFCSKYPSKVDVNYRPNENEKTPLMIAMLNTRDCVNEIIQKNAYSVIDILLNFNNIDITLKNNKMGVNALDMTYELKNEILFTKILGSQVSLFINESIRLKTNEPLKKFDNLILGFKNYILNKTPILNNSLEELESNSSYKKKYGNFITEMRKKIELEVNKYSPIHDLDEIALLEYINGPPQLTPVKEPKQNKKNKKIKPLVIKSEDKIEKILPQPIPPKNENKIIEQKIIDLPVEPNILVKEQITKEKQIIQKQIKDQKKIEKQVLKQKCAEIQPYWLNVIVTTELIKEKEHLNITIYQYFDTFKNIMNELIRNKQFETFKTNMKELIPNFTVTAQSQYLYPNYSNEMFVFGVVVTFLSYILYKSKTCILYFKGGRSIQMYMENESNDFDFLILPYYNVDENNSIPMEYTDAYTSNPIVANKHREIALEIGKFILWIFKDTPVQFSIIESQQPTSQNSIVKVSLVTRPFPNSDRVHYIPFSDIGYGFEYYDNKIKRLFLSNVYGVNHTKMKIDTLMFSDSLSISFGLGVVFPSLKKLLYERLYYLYLYSYSKQESSSSASAADMYYVNKKLIPQLIKLLNKISVEDPTFKSKLNNFIINNIVSSRNTADKNDEYVRYVNDIFDNPTKYLGK